jgi:hypothetical protein
MDLYVEEVEDEHMIHQPVVPLEPTVGCAQSKDGVSLANVTRSQEGVSVVSGLEWLAGCGLESVI